MMRECSILDVYSLHEHLKSLNIDEDTLMMARGMILLPIFKVLTDDKGVVIVLEEITSNSCKLHAYVSPECRGRVFLKALKDVQVWIKENTEYFKVFFCFTEESIHAELFLRQYGNVSLIESGVYPVYVFDLYTEFGHSKGGN